MLDLAFSPDRRAEEPLYRQLEGHLRGLVRARRIAAGERLPASRELASALGLSRNTVNQAYQALVDDGLLRSHVGQGTFVCGDLPAPPPAGLAAGERAFGWDGLFSRRARALRIPGGHGLADPAPGRDFRGGRVDLDSLPVAELKRAYARALDRAAELADEIDPRGHAPLRAAVARALVARGIACRADEVAIVNGAQQAIDLVARVLIDPGDAVAIEQPGYFGAATAFAACEAHLVGIGVDAEGLRTDELARVLRARRVKLLYTTPAVQSPTGVAMSAARRRALLALADEYQLPVLEDDYDSELRYEAPRAALKNLDGAGQVIYVGTFSKALFAGLRVGYVVAPPPLLRRLVLSRWAADFNTDTVTQAALAEFLESGALERHVRRVRRIYGERRAAMLAALAHHLPEGARWVEPAGGNAVWLRLPDGASAEAVDAEARAAGLGLASGSAFAADAAGAASDAGRHLLLSFARIEAREMDAAVAALGGVIRRAQGRNDV